MAFKFKVPFTVHHDEIEEDPTGEQNQDATPLDPNITIPSNPGTFNPRSDQVDQSLPTVNAPNPNAQSTSPGLINNPTNLTNPTPAQLNAPNPTQLLNKIPTQPTNLLLQNDIVNQLKNTLVKAPQKSDYEPSKGRRAVGAIVGGVVGATQGAKAGVEAAEGIVDKPFKDAYQDFLIKSGALEKGVNLGAEMKRAEALGESDQARLLNAVQRGDITLQEALAQVKEGAKTSTHAKDFEYYKNLSPEDKKAYEDFFLKTQRPGIERISGQMLNTDDAKFLSDKLGKEFKDRAGNVIDVHSLPSNMGLSLISGGTPGQEAYEVVTQPTRNVTQNNVTSVIPSRTPTAPITSGTARPPSTNITQPPGVDIETGEAVPGKAVRTIQTGPTQAPIQPNPQVPAAQAPPIQQTAPQVPPTSNIPQVAPPQVQGQQPTNIPSVKPPNALVSNIPGRQSNVYPYSFVQNQQSKVIPVRTAASIIFGDQKNPQIGSISQYAHLANSAESKERIGAAARMILKSMTEGGENGESIGVSAMGFGAGANTGGIWSWFKNNTGITQRMAAAQGRATDDAVNKLTPEENEYLSRMFAAYGAISGFRGLTGSGIYKFSMQSMERELPLLSLANVPNDKAFNNKLALLGTELLANVENSGIPSKMLPQKDYWRQQVDRLTRESSSTPERKYKVEETK